MQDMEWWRWALAGTSAVLVLAFFAIRFDKLKNDPGATDRSALRKLAPWSLIVPATFLLALLAPWWIGLITVAVPAVMLLVADSFD
jgi:hypothetical protein